MDSRERERLRPEILTVLGDGGTMLMAEAVLSWMNERDHDREAAMVPLHELGGTAEVAEALEITRQAVSNRSARGNTNLPRPVTRVAATPLWDMRTVRASKITTVKSSKDGLS